MKRVELLAPAGNYASFLGAINAGADAVYLGGTKFGARAFADNFSEEEICKAIKYAHLFGKKIYLTVNTLMKNSEMEELFSYVNPFYEVGLDGVIIQDIGVFQTLKTCFPGLELHVSTQMTITGKYGAELLKEMGAIRIVPARELSLEEIKAIKKEVNIEIETFVHGAMCYCYSGQCLFSSILGGRSGNRGKCAQPCRLPYGEEENYPLSLKDMCTIERIPQLIEAGIDSFKVEGRMKRPEYSAGVTSIYRKYIDLYYQLREAGKSAEYKVNHRDLTKLKQLYIRSDLQDGYYYKHNGAEMVTIDQPSYSKTDEHLCAEIRRSYLENEKKIKIHAHITCHVGTNLELKVWNDTVSVSVSEDMVQSALKAPATVESVQKQILKSGSTFFTIEDLQVDLEDNVFLSVKSLNEIRRKTLECLEQELLKDIQRNDAKEQVRQKGNQKKSESTEQLRLTCEVMNREQYLAANESGKISRIYLPADCLVNQELTDCMLQERKSALYIALPFVLRKRDQNYFNHLKEQLLIAQDSIEGVLFKNLEGYQWLKSWGYSGKLMADAGIYNWNEETQLFWNKQGVSITAPYELNHHELNTLKSTPKEMVVYGNIPLMITANCIRKTNDGCKKEKHLERISLKDRYRKSFEVYQNCEHCYNVIVNSLPLSLHNHMDRIRELNIPQVRLFFTGEDAKNVKSVIDFFSIIVGDNSNLPNPPYKEYTNGHFKRGVE